MKISSFPGEQPADGITAKARTVVMSPCLKDLLRPMLFEVMIVWCYLVYAKTKFQRILFFWNLILT